MLPQESVRGWVGHAHLKDDTARSSHGLSSSEASEGDWHCLLCSAKTSVDRPELSALGKRRAACDPTCTRYTVRASRRTVKSIVAAAKVRGPRDPEGSEGWLHSQPFDAVTQPGIHAEMAWPRLGACKGLSEFFTLQGSKKPLQHLLGSWVLSRTALIGSHERLLRLSGRAS